MAKNNQRQPWMKDFVSFELSKEQREHMKSWYVASGDVWSVCETAVADGFVITITTDKKNHCVAARMTHSDPDNPHSKLFLSGRGSTPEKAVLEMLWKHQVLGSVWTSALPFNSDEDW